MQNPYAALATTLTPGVLVLATDKVSMDAFHAACMADHFIMTEWRQRGGYGSQKSEAQQAALSVHEALVAHYAQMEG